MNVKDLNAGKRPDYVNAGWLPLDHTSRRLEQWLEARHDPKWKPRKRIYRPSKVRKLTDQQWRRIANAWEYERQQQVKRHGEPTHALLDPNRVTPYPQRTWISV